MSNPYLDELDNPYLQELDEEPAPPKLSGAHQPLDPLLVRGRGMRAELGRERPPLSMESRVPSYPARQMQQMAMAAPEQQAAEQLESRMQLDVPLINLPAAKPAENDWLGQNIAGPAWDQLIKPGLEFMTSPLGVAGMGVTVLNPAVGSAIFTGMAANEMPIIGEHVGSVLGNPESTPQEKNAARVLAVGAPVLSGLSAVPAVASAGKAMRRPTTTDVMLREGYKDSWKRAMEGGMDEAYKVYTDAQAANRKFKQAAIDVETISVKPVTRLEEFRDAARAAYRETFGMSMGVDPITAYAGAKYLGAEALLAAARGVKTFDDFWSSLPPELKSVPMNEAAVLFAGALGKMPLKPEDHLYALNPVDFNNAFTSDAPLPPDQMLNTLKNRYGEKSLAMEVINTPEFQEFLTSDKSPATQQANTELAAQWDGILQKAEEKGLTLKAIDPVTKAETQIPVVGKDAALVLKQVRGTYDQMQKIIDCLDML